MVDEEGPIFSEEEIKKAEEPKKQPNPQYKKRKGGFFSKIGSLGSWFKKRQKEAGKKIGEGKERAVSGAKSAYQRPITVGARRLAQVSWWIKPLFIGIIIVLIIVFLLGFNIFQFGWLSTIGGLAFIIGGIFLVFLGLEQLSREKNIGYLWLLLGVIFLIYGLYTYGLFSTIYLYIAIVIVALYIVIKSKLRSKNKFFIILGLVVLALIFFFFPNISSFLLSFELLKWIIFLVLFILGFWLIFKKDQQGKYPYRFIGLLLIIVSILSLFLSTILSIIGFDFKTLFSSFRWLIIGFFGLMFLVSLLKGKFTWSILFLFLIILVWFLGSDSGAAFLQSIGIKAQVAGGETFSVRLNKYWDYIKKPELFFARYGEFGNPNIENRALVGLRIEKFEPLIKEFRSSQDLRFTAEVKHYGLPKFKENDKVKSTLGFFCYVVEEKHQTEKGATIEPTLVSYFGKVDVKPGKTQSSSISEGVNKDKLEGAVYGNEVSLTANKVILVDEDLFKNFTKFVTCTFEAGKVPAFLDKETRRAYLNISYENFITRSDIYVYLLGKEAYDKIEKNVLEAGGDLDNEFLYQLRNAASYPGLIDNERRTISEFSSGPVWLQTNVLDQQPLKSGGNEQYTLRVKSMPNSVDWTNAIKAENIYLEVPSWFSPVENRCDFTASGGSEIESTVATRYDVKRLVLKEKFGEITKEKLLGDCSGQGAGCNFLCDFKISEGKEQNIQEYRISAYQITDYTLSQGASFEYIKSRTTAGTIEDNDNKIEEINSKLNTLIVTGTGTDAGSTSPTTQPVGVVG